MNELTLTEPRGTDENVDLMPVAKTDVAKPAEAMTPAQARIDAVAGVLARGYHGASTLQLSKEEIEGLKADFQDDAFKLGAGGNADLLYLEHAFLRDRFDSVIGMGQWALIRSRPHWGEDFTTQKGGKATRLYADCALLVRGCLVAEAIGDMVYYHGNPTQSYGDAAEGSETAAFRRCAKKLGVGLQAWKKDWCEGWKQRQHGVRRADHHNTAQTPQKPVKPATASAEKANPESLAPRSLADRIKTMRLLLGDMEEVALQYLRNFTSDGSDASTALMPNEDLGDLNENAMNYIGAHWKEFMARLKEFAGVAVDATPEDAQPEPEPVQPEADNPITNPTIKGWVKVTNKKETKKKGTFRYGIGIGVATDMNTDEKLFWANTFDAKFMDQIAGPLKGKQIVAEYAEGKYGNELLYLKEAV